MNGRAETRAALVRRFDAIMTIVDQGEAHRSKRLRLVNLFGIALVCVAVEWPSPLATALATAIGGSSLLYVALWAWRRRRDRQEAAAPPLS